LRPAHAAPAISFYVCRENASRRFTLHFMPHIIHRSIVLIFHPCMIGRPRPTVQGL